MLDCCLPFNAILCCRELTVVGWREGTAKRMNPISRNVFIEYSLCLAIVRDEDAAKSIGAKLRKQFSRIMKACESEFAGWEK